MRIRRGNLEDLDLIYALEKECFPDEAWPRYVFEEDLKRSQSIYLIAEVEGVKDTSVKTEENINNAQTGDPTDIEALEATQSNPMGGGESAEIKALTDAARLVPADQTNHQMKSTYLDKSTKVENAEAQVVGYICCGVSVMQAFGHISSIAVATEHRGQGVGGTLLDGLLALTANLGIRIWRAETRSSNRPSLHLFESRGFKRIGQMKGYYDAPVEDGIMLIKTLKSKSIP